MKKRALFILLTVFLMLNISVVFAQQYTDQSNTYKLFIGDNGIGYDDDDPKSTTGTGASNFALNLALESYDTGFGNNTGSGSTNFALKTGLQPTYEAHVAEVATLSNTDSGLSLYSKLLFEIDPNNNQTSADGVRFAVQVSTDSNFATYNYVNTSSNFQLDTVANSDLSTYYEPCAQSTSPGVDDSRWNCGNVVGLKRYIKGLKVNTTYYVRVVAMDGDFTNSQPGPAASATTNAMILSFNLSSNASRFESLSSTRVKTATPDTTITATTNAENGYVVEVYGTGSGSGAVSGLYKSTGTPHLIASTTGDLATSIGTEGYGLQGSISVGTPTLSAPYDPGINPEYVGQILRTAQDFFTKSSPSLITGDQVIATYKANISSTTPSGTNYQDILTYIMSGSF